MDVHLGTFVRSIVPAVYAFVALVPVCVGDGVPLPALYELDDWADCRSELYCMVRVILVPPDGSPLDGIDDRQHFRRTLIDRGVCLRSVDTVGGREGVEKRPTFPSGAWNRSDRYILEREHFPAAFHPNGSAERAASVVINRRLATKHPALTAYTEIEYCVGQSSDVVSHEQMVGIALAMALVFGGALCWKLITARSGNGSVRKTLPQEPCKPFLLFDLYKNFAMVGSVLAHCILFGPFLMPASNTDLLEQALSHPNAQLVGLLSPFLMQAFFMMSAMLLTVHLRRSRTVPKAPSPPPTARSFGAIVAHRLIRLQPLNLLTVGFCALAYHHFIAGPLGPRQLVVEQSACRTRWWMNLLFISNFNMHKPCLPHSWYISADFQLFLLITILLLGMFRWPRKTSLILTVAIGCAFLGPFLTVLWTDFDPVRPNNLHEMRFFLMDSAYMAQLYTPFYNNLNWSVGGLLAGLVYDRYQRCANRKQMHSIVRQLNLFIIVVFPLLLTCGRFTLAASESPPPPLLANRGWLAACYSTFKLSAAAFFSAGALRVLLTEKDFPGSVIVRMGAKLYYCVYLIHMPVFRIVFSSATATTEVTLDLMFRMGMKVFGISYALAILLHHTFEKPVVRFLTRSVLHRV